jgi:pimeloyl-ACP methyl ester carboxylesterase
MPSDAAEPTGAILFLHPWTEWGKSYFYRRGRLAAVRAAGLHALAVDLPGSGGSGARRGFLDRDVADAIAALAQRCSGLPLHVWGISAGGYWAHPALSGAPLATAAVFEDVSPHLMEWSWRTAPWGRPAFLVFRHAFRRSYRFLDLRAHAPHLGLRPVAYVSGAEDRGVRPEDTATLARLAGGAALVIRGAGHLASIKRAESEIVALALEVFARASSRAASGLAASRRYQDGEEASSASVAGTSRARANQ